MLLNGLLLENSVYGKALHTAQTIEFIASLSFMVSFSSARDESPGQRQNRHFHKMIFWAM